MATFISWATSWWGFQHGAESAYCDLAIIEKLGYNTPSGAISLVIRWPPFCWGLNSRVVAGNVCRPDSIDCWPVSRLDRLVGVDKVINSYSYILLLKLFSGQLIFINFTKVYEAMGGKIVSETQCCCTYMLSLIWHIFVHCSSSSKAVEMIHDLWKSSRN